MRDRKPLVYLAGPFSKPDPFVNIRDAVLLAAQLRDTGFVTPLVPHLSAQWHVIAPRPYEDWLAYDLELLARCDALLRFGGASDGADKEVVFANQRGLAVFFSVVELCRWALAWSGGDHG